MPPDALGKSAFLRKTTRSVELLEFLLARADPSPFYSTMPATTPSHRDAKLG
jgi:hypothetical protein